MRAGGPRARATRNASRPASGTCRRSPPEPVVRPSTQLGSVLPFGNSRSSLASASVNENHALCSTPEWAEFMESEVLEPVTAGLDLGNEMLEVGPGPGAATRWLCRRVKRLVALELDPDAAARLADQLDGTNVEVQVGDATRLPYPNAS